MSTAPYYDDGTVTIWHGDCREIDAWLAADVLVTDPPYGIHKSRRGGNETAIIGEDRTGRSSTRVITDDHVRVRNDALTRWGSKPAIVFGYWRAPRPPLTQMRLVWDKGAIGMGGVGPWRGSDEEIYVIGWPNPKGEGGAEPSIIRRQTAPSTARFGHPTPKPVDLMVYLIDHCPAGTIADPFFGSGSTLVAAKFCGRQAVGVEIDERYCEIAAKRCAQGVLWEAL